jgi:hypothetical protein
MTARVLSQHRELCALNTGGSLSPESLSDAVEPVQHPFQHGQVGMVAGLGWPVDHDQVLVGHIADQDPGHAEGKVKPCADLGDGQDLVTEGGDGPLLHGQLRVCSPTEVVETSVSISRSPWLGRVRPPVIAYGRTRRGSDSG